MGEKGAAEEGREEDEEVRRNNSVGAETQIQTDRHIDTHSNFLRFFSAVLFLYHLFFCFLTLYSDIELNLHDWIGRVCGICRRHQQQREPNHQTKAFRENDEKRN